VEDKITDKQLTRRRFLKDLTLTCTYSTFGVHALAARRETTQVHNA